MKTISVRALLLTTPLAFVAVLIACTDDVARDTGNAFACIVAEDGTVDECCRDVLKQTPPSVLPGTEPADQVYGDSKGGTFEFDCYGSCGASCNLSGGNRFTTTRCHQWTDCHGNTFHRNALYEVITGHTHPFCRFHDRCYRDCFTDWGEGTWAAAVCIRACDVVCVTNQSFGQTLADCAAWGFTGTGFDSGYTSPGSDGFTSYSRRINMGSVEAGSCSGM